MLNRIVICSVTFRVRIQKWNPEHFPNDSTQSCCSYLLLFSYKVIPEGKNNTSMNITKSHLRKRLQSSRMFVLIFIRHNICHMLPLMAIQTIHQILQFCDKIVISGPPTKSAGVKEINHFFPMNNAVVSIREVFCSLQIKPYKGNPIKANVKIVPINKIIRVG